MKNLFLSIFLVFSLNIYSQQIQITNIELVESLDEHFDMSSIMKDLIFESREDSILIFSKYDPKREFILIKIKPDLFDEYQDEVKKIIYFWMSDINLSQNSSEASLKKIYSLINTKDFSLRLIYKPSKKKYVKTKEVLEGVEMTILEEIIETEKELIGLEIIITNKEGRIVKGISMFWKKIILTKQSNSDLI